MTPFERNQIKQRIYQLRVDNFRAGKLLLPANWTKAYHASLQAVADKRDITLAEAAKLVFDVAFQNRKAEIDLLRFKLGELPSRKDDFQNIELFKIRSS